MGYGIGLAGLASTAEAIDVTSNNIANAQTVGYKSGEYVFADAYFKAADAQAKDRVGMGSFRQSIRRTTSYGNIVNSQNVLDLAIAGPGMFMLAKNVEGTVPVESPSKFEYTRNGQFATDSQNRMCNESGMLVVGYPADAGGNIISGAKSTLTLDQGPLKQQPTTSSVIELNMDNRNVQIGNVSFDATNSATFNQATSQTVYDQYGNGHVLGMYYKKVQSLPLEFTADAAGNLTYTANSAVTPAQLGKALGKAVDEPLADFEQANQVGVLSTTIQGVNAKLSAGTARADLLPGELGTQTIRGAKPRQTSSGPAAEGSTFDIRLADGTHLAARMIDATAGAEKYSVMADRYAVFATIDGNAVGHDPEKDKASVVAGDTEIVVNGNPVAEQVCIGTMAFIGGKNIDTIEKNSDGTPVNNNSTKFKFLANGGKAPDVTYGLNNSAEGRGVLQFSVTSNGNTALTAPAQTYANTQDGHTVSSLTGYSIDSGGKLIASYDNGETAVKGQLILAYFNNVGGLMPNGNNTYAATDKSGEPLLSFPGDGLMGQVRSKSLESSNVDLTNELVKLMVLQRQYSAMSQATKVMAATIIDDTINIGR
jgi:flagellar hook protein FlgE